MTRRQAGDIQTAGGFRFVWDDDGTGAVWRDSTEQDYTGQPEGYVRAAHASRVAGLEEMVTVCGKLDGQGMVMSTLDGAAAFLWGYWSGHSDARDEYADRESLARQSSGPEFVEERPGVWKSATPEAAAKLDDAIDDALSSLGTSLADLRRDTGTGEA
ncbi:hypothetical protein ACIBKZ_15640 [Streptomyces sp. NPDC050421]|uniref:hypothetical protein n=1 Tax=Streptomyces sp. NPDC050421 TaxID=3365613 RepID=UPI0037A5612B